MESMKIDYKNYILDREEVRDKIQIAIDNLSNEDISKKLSPAKQITIHAYIRNRFAYCKKCEDGTIYTPDICDPDKVYDAFMAEKEMDAEPSAVFGYICCVLRDAINDYYRNVERYRKDKKSCTEDWQNSGMTEEEFDEFYTRQARLPRRLIKRTRI